MKKNQTAGFFAVCLLLCVPIFVNGQGNNWKVWVKTAPCSGRYDWVTVAKDNPGYGGGGGSWVTADLIINPAGMKCTRINSSCTFAAATAEAATVRSSAKFFDYCCRNYSVWKNIQSGKYTVVLGQGSAGAGWQFVKGSLCCEEAETLSGIPGACSGPNQQTQQLVKNTKCWPGSYAAWNAQTQKVECFCPTGKKWNDTKTACIDDVGQVNCWPGSYAALNPQTNIVECYCNPGLVWNSTKTACIDPTDLTTGSPANNDPGNNNPGHCSTTDQATFAKVVGSWKSYRMNVTLGGSCDHVSGTWKVTEWCEGVDAKDNPGTRRINGTITGHMDHGTLQVHFASADSPNQKADNGDGTCELNGDGTLECSFGCRTNMKKQ